MNTEYIIITTVVVAIVVSLWINFDTISKSIHKGKKTSNKETKW